MEKAAAVIADNKDQILEHWVKMVKQELAAPNTTIEPVIRDHVPLLLDDITKIMQQYESFDIQVEKEYFDGTIDHSKGHGRHRAATSGYDMAQVLKEYIILHKILTNLLRSNEVYTTEVSDVLKYTMEESMTFAAVAFQQSLLEVRQKFMSVLLHDVRNPVSAAHLAAEMLEQDHNPEMIQKLKGMLKTSLKRALDLMEGFLESITIGAGEGITLHFSERDLLKYIKSVHEEASAIYSNEMILDCPEESITGVFDSAMIRRVLENIVNNAVKYGARGTPVKITVNNEADRVKISIHNEGDPIPEEEQKEIFNFRNTSGGSSPTKLKSWGMGLTLVNAVAEAHGGCLELESTEDAGTTFTLLLKKNANPPGKVKTQVSFGYDRNHLDSF